MTEAQDKIQIKLSTDGKQNQFSPFFVMPELIFERKSVLTHAHTFFLFSVKDRRKNRNPLSQRPGDQRIWPSDLQWIENKKDVMLAIRRKLWQWSAH